MGLTIVKSRGSRRVAELAEIRQQHRQDMKDIERRRQMQREGVAETNSPAPASPSAQNSPSRPPQRASVMYESPFAGGLEAGNDRPAAGAGAPSHLRGETPQIGGGPSAKAAAMAQVNPHSYHGAHSPSLPTHCEIQRRPNRPRRPGATKFSDMGEAAGSHLKKACCRTSGAAAGSRVTRGCRSQCRMDSSSTWTVRKQGT
jgi:hypothetical protein